MTWVLGAALGALLLAAGLLLRTPVWNLHRLAEENRVLKLEYLQLKEEAVMALTRALEASDPATYHHSKRVMGLSLELAKAMQVSETDLEILRVAALLHDIGKIGLAPSVLHKPAPLTAGEAHHVRLHPVIGRRIVEPIRILEQEGEIIRLHHERFDGKGYPDGFLGEAIPLLVRILSVADAFDAISSDRTYRKAHTRADALAQVEAMAGSHFDPEVVAAFAKLLSRRPRTATGPLTA